MYFAVSLLDIFRQTLWQLSPIVSGMTRAGNLFYYYFTFNPCHFPLKLTNQIDFFYTSFGTLVRLSVIAFASKPLYFQPCPKVMQRFFWGCTGPHFGPTNTNHTKNYQKTLSGHFLGDPPQNALQCTTLQYNVL